MRIAVLSDTHGHLRNTNAAIRQLVDEQPEAVLHCGDIGSPDIIPMFAAWPTHFVFGNVDYDGAALRAAAEEAGQKCHGRFGEIELGGRRIALLHSDDHTAFREAIESGQYDLVCYGHTHEHETHSEGDTVVLNPGALYRAVPHTYAMVDLDSLDVRFVIVND